MEDSDGVSKGYLFKFKASAASILYVLKDRMFFNFLERPPSQSSIDEYVQPHDSADSPSLDTFKKIRSDIRAQFCIHHSAVQDASVYIEAVCATCGVPYAT